MYVCVRPVVLDVLLQNFYAADVITSELQNCCSEECLSTVPRYFLLSFISYFIFKSQVRNLQMSVDKLVGMVSVNLLHHVKLVACVIINVPAAA